MFCTKCGKEMPDGGKFCTSCGAPLQAEPRRGSLFDGRGDLSASNIVLSSENSTLENPNGIAVEAASACSGGSAGSTYPGQIERASRQGSKEARRSVLVRQLTGLAIALVVAICAIAISYWLHNHGERTWSDEEPESLYDIETLASMETTSLVEYLEGCGMVYLEDEYSESDLSELFISEDVHGWAAETKYYNDAIGLESLAGGEYRDLSEFVAPLADVSPDCLTVILYSYGNDGDNEPMDLNEIQDGMRQNRVTLEAFYAFEDGADAIEIIEEFCDLCGLAADDKVLISSDNSEYVKLGTGKMYGEDAIWECTCCSYSYGDSMTCDIFVSVTTKDSFSSITGANTIESYERFLIGEEGYSEYSLSASQLRT